MASMKVTALFVPLFLVLLEPTGYSEGPPKCKGNAKVIGACYSVHGRLSLGADTVELRLWPVGTQTMLGVSNGPEINDAENPIYPKAMNLPSAGKDIYGDFEVCPFTPERKGAMQFVCIESASHLVAEH